MKDPEVPQAIVIHHCLSHEIVFQLIKKVKIDHSHIHNGGKMW